MESHPYKISSKAFLLGAADYLINPIHHEFLLRKIEEHLQTTKKWKTLHTLEQKASPATTSFMISVQKKESPIFPLAYGGFQEFLLYQNHFPMELAKDLKRPRK